MHTVTDTPTGTPTAAADLRLGALEQQVAGLVAQLQLAEERALALEARMEELCRARIFADAFEAEASVRGLTARRPNTRAHAAVRGPRDARLRLVVHGGAS